MMLTERSKMVLLPALLVLVPVGSTAAQPASPAGVERAFWQALVDGLKGLNTCFAEVTESRERTDVSCAAMEPAFDRADSLATRLQTCCPDRGTTSDGSLSVRDVMDDVVAELRTRASKEMAVRQPNRREQMVLLANAVRIQSIAEGRVNTIDSVPEGARASALAPPSALSLMPWSRGWTPEAGNPSGDAAAALETYRDDVRRAMRAINEQADVVETDSYAGDLITNWTTTATPSGVIVVRFWTGHYTVDDRPRSYVGPCEPLADLALALETAARLRSELATSFRGLSVVGYPIEVDPQRNMTGDPLLPGQPLVYIQEDRMLSCGIENLGIFDPR